MASPSNEADSSNEVKLARFPHLYIKLDTPKGRGVFTGAPIPRGTILDVCPVLLLTPEENAQHIAHTTVYHYTYNWPLPSTGTSPRENGDTEPASDPRRSTQKQTQAVVLGLGSMFNHSGSQQNVGWSRDLQRQVIIYRALQDIETGEELCISYGDRLTFEDAEQSNICASEENENEILARIDVDAEA